MMFTIQCCTLQDTQDILQLYATAHKDNNVDLGIDWGSYNIEWIENEIIEKKLWKIIIRGELACIWAISFEHTPVWEENKEALCMYIDRMITISAFKGQMLTKIIGEWAKGYAIETGRKYIRLSTYGLNVRWVDYLTRCGFEFVGVKNILKKMVKHDHPNRRSVYSLFQISLTS